MQPMSTDHDLATWLQQQRLAQHAQPEPRHSVRLRGDLDQLAQLVQLDQRLILA